MHFFEVNNPEAVDSPALLVFPDRVRANIERAKNAVQGDLDRLRPHIKTHKTAAVMRLMLEAGIRKVKCATPAEAAMAARAGVPDVLLAYQPVPTKARLLLELTERFPDTDFACLLDNEASAAMLDTVFSEKKRAIRVFLDLNVGQHRTGLVPDKALALWQFCKKQPGLAPVGLHAYDGHIRTGDLGQRQRETDAAFAPVAVLAEAIGEPLTIVAGGSPSFPCHAQRREVECSPGTFVFWDWGYAGLFPDQHFEWAAILMTRVVSILDEKTLCLDLGHKAVAAENPLTQRVKFLNVPTEVVPRSQSEEHLVVEVPDARAHRVGDIWYGVPFHICPTVALYDHLCVVENGAFSGIWPVSARGRLVSF